MTRLVPAGAGIVERRCDSRIHADEDENGGSDCSTPLATVTDPSADDFYSNPSNFAGRNIPCLPTLT